jgi:hypothetical protein
VKRCERVLVRRACRDHRHRDGFIVLIVVLIGADAHVIARLKFADVGFTAGSIEVFRRARGRDSGDRLVVFLDGNGLVADVAQYPDERARVRLTILCRTALLRIPLARISPAGKSNAGTADHDLAKTGNGGQQENDC